MEFKYEGHSKKSGVYKITNTINGKVYVGSAKEFKRRGRGHFSSLKKGKHQNKHLQASFNKHGSDAFLFEVIEVVPGDKIARTTREQFYLDQELENWERCFNFKKKSASKERSCWSRTPEESSKKRSENSKKMWENPGYREMMSEKISKAKTGVPRSAETRAKISRSHMGVTHTEETKKKISESMKKLLRENPEMAEKRRANLERHRGKKHSSDAKRKIGEASKAMWSNPEFKERTSKERRGKKLSKETRKKMSEAQKRQHQRKRNRNSN